jgi:hypothetical protein
MFRLIRHHHYVSVNIQWRTQRLTEITVDDISEHERWIPYYGEDADTNSIAPENYPPYKTHAISCFEHTCKLAIILNDIIARLYARKRSANFDHGASQLRQRLDTWRNDLPLHLRYDPDHLPLYCPPPHIINQK